MPNLIKQDLRAEISAHEAHEHELQSLLGPFTSNKDGDVFGAFVERIQELAQENQQLRQEALVNARKFEDELVQKIESLEQKLGIAHMEHDTLTK